MSGWRLWLPIPDTEAEPVLAGVARVREALGEQGFGVLTEIDDEAGRRPRAALDHLTS